MTQRLRGYLYQTDEAGSVHMFVAGLDRAALPAWVKVDDGAFEDDGEAATVTEMSERPAKTATKAEWVAYATAAGVDVPDDATKAEVIAVLTGQD